MGQNTKIHVIDYRELICFFLNNGDQADEVNNSKKSLDIQKKENKTKRRKDER